MAFRLPDGLRAWQFYPHHSSWNYNNISYIHRWHRLHTAFV